MPPTDGFHRWFNDCLLCHCAWCKDTCCAVMDLSNHNVESGKAKRGCGGLIKRLKLKLSTTLMICVQKNKMPHHYGFAKNQRAHCDAFSGNRRCVRFSAPLFRVQQVKTVGRFDGWPRASLVLSSLRFLGRPDWGWDYAFCGAVGGRAWPRRAAISAPMAFRVLSSKRRPAKGKICSSSRRMWLA